MIKNIPNHAGFTCDENGVIYGKRGKPLIGYIDRCGYREVLLSENGITKNYLAHRLILSTFSPIDNMADFQVNHKNGNKSDNRVSNLEWCTRSYNIKHAYDTGLERRMCGERHHAHKLTSDDVRYIRKVYKKRDAQYGAVPLSNRFGVDRTTIHDIIRHKTWRETHD
jgi:hypothetical protein